ncbi:glutaredoxin family protein [Tepidiforma sp.]|uniref:glutaredoxin family protein n=1 Tax=Tepidiforma sp. TaxID=2682230 RepID=UPI002ADDB149|nr:glutaredoxin family protein [Tepidiforma sp.]
MSEPLPVTLYRRDGCGLCDRAEAELARIARRLPIRVVPVDIAADAVLEARYFLEIPVVEAAGRVVARAPIAAPALEAALRELLSPGR